MEGNAIIINLKIMKALAWYNVVLMSVVTLIMFSNVEYYGGGLVLFGALLYSPTIIFPVLYLNKK